MSENPIEPVWTTAARLLCALLPVGLLAACGPAPGADASADLIVYGARVWDGTGAGLSEPAVLRVAAGRILSVEPLDEDADMAPLTPPASSSFRG